MTRSLTLRRGAPARGFSLVELMVTVAIVGILAAVAYPAYGNYLIRNNRAAAQVHLMELAQAQSQFMADSRSYATSIENLGMTTPAAVSAKYRIAIDVQDGPPASFTITARAIGSQAGDGDLSINSAGTRSPAAKW